MRPVPAALLALALVACSDDAAPTVDAPTGIVDADIDSGGDIDAPAACNLPTTTIACTVGNDAPCTAVCPTAYCFNFNQVGVVCTKPCNQAIPTDCPTGWTCNNMGRCRPPG